MKKALIFFFILLLLSIIGCAKRGSITGGTKDTIAPVLKLSFPKNFSANFNSKSIKLTFDEYVKLKDVNKQLIISPPLTKNPQILPLSASKSITINFLDSLKTNTTYHKKTKLNGAVMDLFLDAGHLLDCLSSNPADA